MKNDQLVLKNSIIYSTDEVENSWFSDAVCRNVLLFLKESIKLQKLLIKGADFYANCKGWKKCQK